MQIQKVHKINALWTLYYKMIPKGYAPFPRPCKDLILLLKYGTEKTNDLSANYFHCKLKIISFLIHCGSEGNQTLFYSM